MANKVKLTANILFSGIGAQERGFRNSGLFDIEVVSTADISKEAVVSYAAIHCGMTPEMIENYECPSKEEMIKYLENINLGYDPNKKKVYDWKRLASRKDKMKGIEKYYLACKLTNNLGDISKIEKLPYADFWTISSPCTDISLSGQMKGLDKDSGTRSSLVWDSARLLETAKDEGRLPKYIMMENVKNLVSKKFKDQFDIICSTLDEIGFNIYWQVLNGKDCGIPQNRERVFVIGIRKDIDKGKFTFPKPFDSGLRLRDMLEDEVDEKYYIENARSEQLIQELIDNGSIEPLRERESKQGCDLSINNPKVTNKANCIKARYDSGITNRQSDNTGVITKECQTKKQTK